MEQNEHKQSMDILDRLLRISLTAPLPYEQHQAVIQGAQFLAARLNKLDSLENPTAPACDEPVEDPEVN